MISTLGKQHHSDSELLELSRQGDRTAFGELLSRHYEKCGNLATAILRDRAAASDEVQNACCQALRHLNDYRGTAEFWGWMSVIVANQCRMNLRRSRKRPQLPLEEVGAYARITFAEHAGDPEQDLMTDQMLAVVRREMSCLPPLLRNVALLCDVEGLPMEEVAARLGLTVAAAKSRLVRARTEVRARVSRHVGTAEHRGRSAVRTLPAKPVGQLSADW
jgi:RNA polymerase sigma-70 factor (ECF subfamily)